MQLLRERSAAHQETEDWVHRRGHVERGRMTNLPKYEVKIENSLIILAKPNAKPELYGARSGPKSLLI